MNIRKILALTSIVIIAAMLTGCLECEKKSYTWNFTSPNSGTLTVKYINIESNINNKDTELKPEVQMQNDFNDLKNRFVDGTEAEHDFPDAKFISKRLFEEDGKLCGEIVFEFDEISQVKLYRHNNSGPFMFFSSDSVISGNGIAGPKYMPVVFWDSVNKIFNLTTKMSDDTTSVSLIDLWKQDKQKQH